MSCDRGDVWRVNTSRQLCLSSSLSADQTSVNGTGWWPDEVHNTSRQYTAFSNKRRSAGVTPSTRLRSGASRISTWPGQSAYRLSRSDSDLSEAVAGNVLVEHFCVERAYEIGQITGVNARHTTPRLVSNLHNRQPNCDQLWFWRCVSLGQSIDWYGWSRCLLTNNQTFTSRIRQWIMWTGHTSLDRAQLLLQPRRVYICHSLHVICTPWVKLMFHYNFGKYEPVFNILSPVDSEGYLQCKLIKKFPLLLHCPAKFKNNKCYRYFFTLIVYIGLDTRTYLTNCSECWMLLQHT